MSAGCQRPPDLATLVDYWFGDLAPPDQERLEEHLLECDECGGWLRALVTLGDGLRRLAHEGAVQVVVTPSFLERAAREGLQTRQYRAASGERVACTVTSEDDLLVSRLQADLGGVSRLDLVVEQDGQSLRFEDVPFDPDAQEVILAQAMPAMRALGQAVLRVRLFACEAEAERILGEYTFAHTPTRS